MNIQETTTVTKLIKEIKYKLNELEKLVGKTTKAKYTYPMNNHNQQQSPPRKRNVYQNSDGNSKK